MAIDARKRQKKLERRAAKRKSKVQQLVKEKHAGLGGRLADASRHPVLHCGVITDIWTEGLGWVWLSRKLPNGSIAFGIFLVDRYCLGVKNAVADIRSEFDYNRDVMSTLLGKYATQELQPAAARKLVESAVEYARQLGFPPHADYHKARHIFGDIDAAECTEEFEFGKDGKPLFIAGPNDTPGRCWEIIKMLRFQCGENRFHSQVPFSPSIDFPE